MGYVSGVGFCGICGQVFTFNPERVPTFPIDLSRPPGLTRLSTEGSAEPVCHPCFDLTNELRKESGLEPNVHLSGAWDGQEIT